MRQSHARLRHARHPRQRPYRRRRQRARQQHHRRRPSRCCPPARQSQPQAGARPGRQRMTKLPQPRRSCSGPAGSGTADVARSCRGRAPRGRPRRPPRAVPRRCRHPVPAAAAPPCRRRAQKRAPVQGGPRCPRRDRWTAARPPSPWRPAARPRAAGLCSPAAVEREGASSLGRLGAFLPTSSFVGMPETPFT